MRGIYTFIILLFLASVSAAQGLTGIWRGYFLQSTFHLRSGQFVEDKYKYEIQINSLPTSAIEGVTYSYKTTLFYGKAATQGIYSKKTKVLLLKETKMLELKIADQSVACLMTCYLDYTRSADGSKETLTGTYTSTNELNGSECGSGTVYLEKVTTTDFEKEDFLLKKTNPATAHKKQLSHLKKPLNNTLAGTTNKMAMPKSLSGKPAIKPGAEDFVVKKEAKKTIIAPPVIDTAVVNTPTLDTASIVTTPIKIDTAFVIPEVLQKRENVLSHSLIVDGQDVTVEFYDNGQIDGDTISVYHDNRAVIRNRRLGYSPITMQVHIDEKNPVYEFITVAENLGTVPPNTALVIISAGSKHYEINIASDEQRNAKIVLNYQKPPDRK